MKHAIALIGFLFFGHAALATTACSIEVSSTGNTNFDRTNWSGDVSSVKYILVKNEAKTAEEFQWTGAQVIDQLKASDGASVVTLSPQPDGKFSATVSHVEAKMENILPIDAMIVGAVIGDQFNELVVPTRGLAVVCYDRK
jgi:hypothetical protein